MKTGNNKWLIILLAALLACCLVTGTLFACEKEEPTPTPPTPTPTVEGAEKGVYALEETTLTLNGLGSFTLSQGETLSSGTYAVADDGVITLTFGKTEEGTAKCTVQGNLLVLTLASSEYRLYKQVKLSVTFDNGESTSVVKVTNGDFVAKPTDPVKEGYKFIAWYKAADFSGKPFDFQTEKVTEDFTLHAKWLEYTEGTTEYTVSFNLGYDNAPTVASQRTIGAKLVDGAPVPTREGYTFKGWWISAYEQADKLTNQYADGNAFTADTTLFALWQQDGTTLATMDVTSAGVSWAGITTESKLVVTKPDGTTQEQTFGATGASAYKFDLTAQPAGNYKFTLTYGENTVERYYLNKALARVSGFKVVGNSILLFDGVDNADGYYITVKCGDPDHTHTNVYLGKSTSYNFVNCPMCEGGIEFTVNAVSSNYFKSTATFKFDRSLAAVANIAYDATTGYLTWAEVENAQHYLVTVGGNEYFLGTETKLNIKALPAGELNVTVKAMTEGFNSQAATSATIQKTNQAAPSGLAVKKGVLSWTAVEGATAYRVQINDTVVDVTEAQLALDATYIALGKEYAVKVKAVFETTESLWSDAFALSSAKSDVGLTGLTYQKGTFSWTAMADADTYEYKINDGVVTSTANNFASVQLTKSGANLLEVRYLSLTGESSEWASYEVYAYEITLDSMGGAGVDKQYKAVGDAVEFPSTERVGYDFDGWYNVAGGSASNGTQFTAKTFDNPANVVLYANWLPRSYDIVLEYNGHGEGETTTKSVTYTKGYTLPVPKMLTDDESAKKAFVGWYATADGKGVQYTDELGNCLKPWNITENTTVYAKYVDAFAFSPDGEGGYSVKASKNLGYYTESITIPATYKGLPVRSIAEYGFKDFYYLKNVTLPDCLESIPTTAFEGCKRIERFSMVETGKTNPTFSVKNNSLLMTLYGETTLHMIPTAATGTYRVPAEVSGIGSRTFNKAKFDTVVIPSTVNKIDADAFVGCSSLKAVIFDEADVLDNKGQPIAKQKLFIDNAAFNDTLYVEKFVLPARLAEITNVQEFFSQFKLLSSIEVVGEFNEQVYASFTEHDGKNLNGMLGNAAKDEIVYCPISLSSAPDFQVEIPGSVISIATHAFDSFTESKVPALKKYNPVTKVTFQGSIARIGDYAFNKARNLTEVTFKATRGPVGFTVGNYAFNGCSKLATVTFEEKGAWSTEDDQLFVATESCGVQELGEYAFAGTAITELKLPNSLKVIGNNAFERCTSLKSIDLANVSPALTFGNYSFGWCRLLTKVELTKNVGAMNFNLVFYECSKLDLSVSPDNPNYTAGDGGVLYNKDMTMVLFFPDSFEGVYTIPDTVTTIAGAVFKGKSNMLAIVISKNVVEIGDSAFEDCRNLKSVTFAADGTENLTIGKKAFFNCTSLTEIEIPGRVTSLGESCFSYYGVDGALRILNKVTLNEGLQTIGKDAFEFTDKLATIHIPSTVTSIGENAFYFSGLTTITFAESATELALGDAVFYNCANLQSVVFPEGLINIPYQTFYNNSSLKSVTIPTTVRNLGDQRAIGVNAFYGCSSLSEIVFTKGGTEPLSFGGGAFNGCDALTKLSLPNRIASLDTSKFDVFELGTNGSTDDGPFNMVNCNVYAWKNTYVSGSKDISNLAEIEVEEGGTEYSSYKGVLYNADKSVLVWCPFGKVGEVEVAKETTKFRASAFNNCHHITSVVFEKGGTADFVMEDNTKTGTFDGTTPFFGCYNLKTITFPARLKSLGSNALKNDTGITEYTPDGKPFYSTGTAITKVLFEDDCKLESIGDNAFDKLEIDELVLPSGVKTVGKNVFNGSPITKITLSEQIDATSLTNITTSADNLTSIIVPTTSTTLKSEYDGQIIYSKDMTKVLYVVNEFETDVYTVPSTITEIAANTFKGRTGIKSIVFAPAEEGATLKIGNKAFAGTGITSIVLPANIIEFGKNVFEDCADLTTVTFAKGYKYATIPDYTFKNCKSLKSIVIPGEVSSIDRGAFMGADSLESVEFGLTTTSREPGLGGMSVIAADVFNNCYALKTIRYALKLDENGNVVYAEGNTLPHTVVTLGLSGTYSSGPFKNCTSLVEITLPENEQFTTIGKNMFDGCVALKNVNLPTALTEIKQNAFANSGITTLDLSKYQANSLTIYEGAFTGCEDLTELDLSKVKTLYLYQTFNNCKSLTSLEFGSSTALKGTEKKPATYYNGFKGSGLKTVTINQNVLNSMFDSCTSLETVILGANVTEIKESAFAGCSGLTTVDTTAVDTLTIGASSFKGATSLKAFDLSKATAIGKNAFQNCASLTTVGTFNEKITSLLEGVFDGSGLTSIDLANSKITQLGNYVFRGTALTSVTIPSTITKIGSGVFANCTSLGTADYQSTVATLPGSLFSGCTSLTSVTIGDKVTKLSSSAFANTALTEINLNNVATVDSKVFENCTALKIVTIKNQNIVFANGGDSFLGVSGVQFVVPEGGTLSADGGILYKGTKLVLALDTRKEVEVKAGTTSIGPTAFRYNTYVEKVTLPVSLTTIEGYFTFAGCTNLKSINLQNVTEYKTTSIKSTTQDTFKDTAITEIEIPNPPEKVFRRMPKLTKVTIISDEDFSIADYAFAECPSLATIEVSGEGKITGVGSNAFSECYSLRNLDAFQSVTTMGMRAFSESGLVTAVIPEGMTALVGYVFQSCPDLVSVTIPASLTTFDKTAFNLSKKIAEVINLGTLPITAGSTEYGGVALYALNVTTENETAVEFVNNYVFLSDGADNYLLGYIGEDTQLTLPTDYHGNTYKIHDYAFNGKTTITSVTGNSAITGIGAYAFYGCKALTSVSGFTAVKYIGEYAFYNCPIASITLPKDLEEIGDYAFKGCNDLVLTESDNLYYLGSSENLYMVLLKPIDTKAESYEINRATKYIASEAFSGCSALTSIVIPEGVKTIGAKAFYNCSALTSVTVPSSVTSIGDEAFSGCTALTEVNLSEGLVTIGANAFYGCEALTNIVLPQSATDLGEKLFYNCEALTDYTLSSKLTKVPDYMFYGCSSLTTITLPEGVTSIGEYAFNGCSKLTSLSNLDNVTEIGEKAFCKCTALTTIGSIANVESIGDYAFESCTALKELTITGKTTYIGQYAFKNWTASQTVTFTEHTAASPEWHRYWNKSGAPNFVWATAVEGGE